MSRTVKAKLTGGKAVAKSCQNHGGCPWCYGNRMISTLRRLEATKQEKPAD